MKYSAERIKATAGARWGSLTQEQRFWEKVDATGDCWLWTGGTTRGGYGAFHWDGIGTRAHRLAYIVLVGPIANELVIDHLCRVKICVNPDHMEVVTQGENVRRGRAGYAPKPTLRGPRVTHCVHGHLYDAANTMHLSGNRRQCRQCHRLRNQAAYFRGQARTGT